MGPKMTSIKRLMSLTTSFAPPCALLATALFCSAARADDAAAAVPSNTLRVGMYFVRYNSSANDLNGPFTPPGLNLHVNRVNTPYAAYLRRLTDHWDLELAAGVPPTTHTLGRGPAMLGSVPFNGQEVATVKWFSPTVLLEYSFFAEQAPLRPFVGAGINYTHFYERSTTAAGQAITGGPTATYLSDSFGPAVTAGVKYSFTRHIHAVVSYSYAQVSSDFDAVTAGISRRTSVHFNPATAVASVGYSF